MTATQQIAAQIEDGGETMSEKSKHQYAVAVVAIVVLALLQGATLYYCFSRPASLPPLSGGEIQTNIISISGTGSAYAMPDLAYVSVAILTQRPTATETQQKNAEITNNVIEGLKTVGVAREDLTTESYSLRPIYNYDRQQTLVGYECRNSLRVTWRKIFEVGIVLDAAVKAGANSIGSVTFALSKQKTDTASADAIKEAVADADARAQTLASALKVTIIGKNYASIGIPSVPRTPTYELKAEATPILPGELRVTVTVNVNYRFA